MRLGGVPLAWRNLTHDKRRFAVSLTGIAFAVLLMFVELGFWNAMLDAAVGMLQQCRGDLVIVSKSTYTLAIREEFSTQRLAQAHSVPGIKAAFPLYFETTNSLWRDTDNRDYDQPRTHPIRVIAFDPAYDAFKDPEIESQRHLLRQRDAVLLDRRSKEDYGKREAPMERELSLKKIEVVGTFALGADFTTDGNLIMSAENFARFFPNPLAPSGTLRMAHLGLIQLKEGVDPQEIKIALRAQLPDDVQVFTMDEFIQEERNFWQNSTPVGFIFTFGLVIGVIVGMVICSQVLQADVASHLKEYATLKAMGYTGSYLTWVVLQEGLWLGVLGFLPALVACLFLYGELAELTELPLYLTPARVAVVFVLTCFIQCRRRRHPGRAQGATIRSGRGVLMFDAPAVSTLKVPSPVVKQPGDDIPLIRIQNLNHYFGQGDARKQVLFENNLEVMPGEIVIMTGPSGSGKTTLLTLIGALRTVQEGSLDVNGKTLNGLTEQELVQVRRRIGFIFQAHNLFSSLSAFQNVCMALQLHNWEGKLMGNRRAVEVLTATWFGTTYPLQTGQSVGRAKATCRHRPRHLQSSALDPRRRTHRRPRCRLGPRRGQPPEAPRRGGTLVHRHRHPR